MNKLCKRVLYDTRMPILAKSLEIARHRSCPASYLRFGRPAPFGAVLALGFAGRFAFDRGTNQHREQLESGQN